MKVWIAHEAGRDYMEPLPEGVSVEVFDGNGYPSDPADVEFWVPPFLGFSPAGALKDMTGLKVIQLLTAGVENLVKEVPAGVKLCNARGVHTESTAEWAMGAILASMRCFDIFARNQSESKWKPQLSRTLSGKTALIVGAGSIGRAIERRLVASDMSVSLVGRNAREGVHTADELPQLLPKADIVVLIVPLTAETDGLVDTQFLSHMKDGALLVNAARGKVVDTEALTAEVATGRLQCALDVTEPEPLPEDHSLWTLDGALITPHVGGTVDGLQERAYAPVQEQLRRYVAGEPLINEIEIEAGKEY